PRGVERPAGPDERFPPGAGGVGRAGQRVADDDLGRLAGRRPVVAPGHDELGQSRSVVEDDRIESRRHDPTRPELGVRGRGRRRDDTPDGLGHPAAPTRSPAVEAWPSAIDSARSRSAIRSSTCSSPTDSRIRSGVVPVVSCSSAVSCEWVVDAGWMINDLASPTLASSEKIVTLSISFRPASTPPRMPKVTIPPKPPFRYLTACLWVGADSRPG